MQVQGPDRKARWVEQGEEALALGLPGLAFDAFREALALDPDDHRTRHRAALALSRAGSIREASHMVAQLLERMPLGDPVASEALSLAGRLAKDRWERLPAGPARRAAAEEGAALYERAGALVPDPYPAVNAATLHLLAGNPGRSRALAGSILERHAAAASDDPDHWLAASLGEASLLAGRPEQALGWYARAARSAGARFGDVATMRLQLRRLATCIPVPDEILSALAVPEVVAFAGHMLDADYRREPRFPEALAPRVQSEIEERLRRTGAGFAYCSAACGGDLLFIERMLERGGEVHVVLPFRRSDFIETSVAFAGRRWVERFEALLGRVSSVQLATAEGHLGDDSLFGYGRDLVMGLALLRAQHLQTGVRLLAVADAGSAPDGPGGTLDTISRWQGLGQPVEVIDLAAIRAGQGGRVARDAPAPPTHCSPGRRSVKRSVKTMLFADVVGFSRLGEEAAPSFFVDFLSEIATVVDASPRPPAFRNTWGDGLFLVYDDVLDAAHAAASLQQRIAIKDWAHIGLPSDTSIRIGMHAGPVFEADDPVIGRRNYYGSHVNRAARIEPVTAPGSTFLSQQAACLLTASGQAAFSCEYLGQVDLAKAYGREALYRLRRHGELD